MDLEGRRRAAQVERLAAHALLAAVLVAAAPARAQLSRDSAVPVHEIYASCSGDGMPPPPREHANPRLPAYSLQLSALAQAWGVAYTGTRETAGPDRLAWIVVLLIQSVPYASSLIVSLVSAFPLPARWLGTSYRAVAGTGRPAQA